MDLVLELAFILIHPDSYLAKLFNPKSLVTRVFG